MQLPEVIINPVKVGVNEVDDDEHPKQVVLPLDTPQDPVDISSVHKYERPDEVVLYTSRLITS